MSWKETCVDERYNVMTFDEEWGLSDVVWNVVLERCKDQQKAANSVT
jgi:hypothetical protein